MNAINVARERTALLREEEQALIQRLILLAKDRDHISRRLREVREDIQNLATVASD